MELTAIVESLLFATQEPLPLTQMVTAVKEAMWCLGIEVPERM